MTFGNPIFLTFSQYDECCTVQLLSKFALLLSDSVKYTVPRVCWNSRLMPFFYYSNIRGSKLFDNPVCSKYNFNCTLLRCKLWRCSAILSQLAFAQPSWKDLRNISGNDECSLPIFTRLVRLCWRRVKCDDFERFHVEWDVVGRDKTRRLPSETSPTGQYKFKLCLVWKWYLYKSINCNKGPRWE